MPQSRSIDRRGKAEKNRASNFSGRLFVQENNVPCPSSLPNGASSASAEIIDSIGEAFGKPGMRRLGMKPVSFIVDADPVQEIESAVFRMFLVIFSSGSASRLLRGTPRVSPPLFHTSRYRRLIDGKTTADIADRPELAGFPVFAHERLFHRHAMQPSDANAPPLHSAGLFPKEEKRFRFSPRFAEPFLPDYPLRLKR